MNDKTPQNFDPRKGPHDQYDHAEHKSDRKMMWHVKKTCHQGPELAYFPYLKALKPN